MHGLQLELVDLLRAGMPGVTDTQNRADFARELRGLLNDTLPGGRPGLARAVDAGSLAAAVEAQEVINHLVGTWSGEVVVTEFEPPNEQAIGQLLTVNGRNFAFPPRENTVTIGGEPVEAFLTGSNDARLVFEVPEIPDVGEGLDVVVRIESGERVVEADYHVLPREDVEGNPPEIASILREDGSSNLRVGEVAVIAGTDFGEDVEAVSIALRHRGTGERVPVPAANLGSVEPTEIRFTVPPLEMLPEFGNQIFDLELAVGDHRPAIADVNIRRAAGS
jgi:hypothetical protein